MHMIYTPYFDWEAVHRFFEERARCLAKAEKKSGCVLGFSPDRCTVYEVEGRRFVAVMSNTFEGILTRDLPEATRVHPDLFGTNNPEDVLQALFNVRSGYESRSFEEFKQILSTEQFCWIAEIDIPSGLPKGDLLRIDLYRNIQGAEFRGGLFHAFKHFAYDGVPLSYKEDQNNISSPMYAVDLIIQGFFLSSRILVEGKRPTDYESYSKYGDHYKLHFSFYREAMSCVYFLNTIIKKLS